MGHRCYGYLYLNVHFHVSAPPLTGCHQPADFPRYLNSLSSGPVSNREATDCNIHLVNSSVFEVPTALSTTASIPELKILKLILKLRLKLAYAEAMIPTCIDKDVTQMMAVLQHLRHLSIIKPFVPAHICQLYHSVNTILM